MVPHDHSESHKQCALAPFSIIAAAPGRTMRQEWGVVAAGPRSSTWHCRTWWWRGLQTYLHTAEGKHLLELDRITVLVPSFQPTCYWDYSPGRACSRLWGAGQCVWVRQRRPIGYLQLQQSDSCACMSRHCMLHVPLAWTPRLLTHSTTEALATVQPCR